MISRASVLFFLMAIVPVSGLAGQAGGAPSQAPPVPDSVDLRFEREIFQYPAFERRNPFRPLLADEAGPRFEDVELLGVLFSPVAGQSMALLGLAGGAVVRPDSVVVESGVEAEVAPPPGADELRATRSRTNRMRVGDRWGNIRLVTIERNRVLVDVTEFGLTERRELLLRRPDAGGIR